MSKVTPHGEDWKKHHFSLLSKKTFPALPHLTEQSGYIQTLKGQGIIKPSHYALTQMRQTYTAKNLMNRSCLQTYALQFSFPFLFFVTFSWYLKRKTQKHAEEAIHLQEKKKNLKQNKVTNVLDKKNPAGRHSSPQGICNFRSLTNLVLSCGCLYADYLSIKQGSKFK